MVRGNSQQVKMARGPEILSIKNKEFEKLKSCRKIQDIEKNAIKKPWVVIRVHKCLGGARKVVRNTESQAEIIISIAED